jgi:hypothetical protein
LKHYERNRMHAAIMGAIRGEIERELAQPGQTGVLALGEIRAAAEVEHYRAFPKPPTSAQLAATSPIAKQRTYYYWAGVPLFVAGLGLWSLLIVVL